jgi:hypothetical protein
MQKMSAKTRRADNISASGMMGAAGGLILGMVRQQVLLVLSLFQIAEAMELYILMLQRKAMICNALIMAE